MQPEHYWLGLTRTPGIGPIRLRQIVQYFGGPAQAWQASERDLHESGLPERPLRQFLKHRAAFDLAAEYRRVERAGARLLTWTDDDYPPALRELDDAPLVLYVRGALQPADDLAIAVVGTRKATRYGTDAATLLSRQLAEHGVTVVSGLAQGIDAAAHRGALEGGGRTLAVLGCGIDILYPRENAELAHAIGQHGAILSEFPLGTPPSGAHFPRRNRILSGLTRGVLIVEAPERSGALITATAAAEQGRDVFAVPGNIFNKMSHGANRLIQDGAKLVLDVRDILDELQVAFTRAETRQKVTHVMAETPGEARLLTLLEADPIHIDDLIRSSGLSASEVATALTLLELKGLAQNTGAMQYSRTRY